MKREWLIHLRGNKTQEKVSSECGISQNFYSAIETGERTPSVATAKAIAKRLNFDWTMFYEDKKESVETKI